MDVTLTPIPLMKFLDWLNPRAQQLLIPVAEENSFHAPREKRRLRVCRKCLPGPAVIVLWRIEWLDKVCNHAMHAIGCSRIPPLLKILIVLEDTTDDFLLPRQQR